MTCKIELKDGTFESGRGVPVTVKRIPQPDCLYGSEAVEISYGRNLHRYLPDVDRCTARARKIFHHFIDDRNPDGEPIPERKKKAAKDD